MKNPFIPQQQLWTHSKHCHPINAQQYLLAIGSDAGFQRTDRHTGCGHGHAARNGLPLIVVGFVLLFVVHKMADSAKGLPAIFAFTGVWGASIGPMLSMYLALENGPTIVLQALAGTALIFFSLSAYALNTKKDFSYMGGFLMTVLIVVIVAAVANIFLAIPALSLTVSAAVVMIMAGLILFDTSRIINGGETNYIRATVGLYLNIFNLFIHLLHLIAVFTGGDD